MTVTITWIRYDWKETLTLEKISDALKPHGLTVKQFINGYEFEFVIASKDETDDKIIDTIIDDFDNEEENIREILKSMLVARKGMDKFLPIDLYPTDED